MTHLADGMFKGIGLGTLIASAALILGLTLLDPSPAPADDLAFLPVTACFVLAFTMLLIGLASLTVGLPVIWLLSRFDCISGEIGAIAGALVGGSFFFTPALIAGDGLESLGWVFAIAAMLGGGTTGAVWGEVQDCNREIIKAAHPNRLNDNRILR